jgi:hypothetical protein
MFSNLVVQYSEATRLPRLQATDTGRVRAGIRRVAGCTNCECSAGHASAEANPELTFDPDHSVGADHDIAAAKLIQPDIANEFVSYGIR